MLYGTATDGNGAAMAEVWIQVKQGSNTATTKTDLSGDYVLFDGQQCTPTDGIHGGCTGAWTSVVTFGNGSVSTTMTLLGQGPVSSGAAAFPAGSTSAQVRTITQATPLTTIVTPVYTFTAKKGDAATATSGSWRSKKNHLRQAINRVVSVGGRLYNTEHVFGWRFRRDSRTGSQAWSWPRC